MNKPISKKLNRATSQGWTQFLAAADRLQITLTDAQLDLIEQFVLHLSQFNEHTNLVSNSDPDVILQDHVVDSLTLVPIMRKLWNAESETAELIDIGSGAGFPALVLTLVIPQLTVVCVDSVGKKTRFLEEVGEVLQLGARFSVINDRAEMVARHPKLRSSFSFATARAVGKLDLVSELTLPFLTIGGYLLAQKSTRQVHEELPNIHDVLSLLGAEVLEVLPVDPEIVHRDLSVVVVQKMMKTPNQFPRPTAQLKTPLVG